MNKVVTVKNIKIGEGIPKIAIPISDSDYTGIKKSVNLIMNSPCDLIEWRGDFYNDVTDPEVRIKPLTLFRNQLCSIYQINAAFI